MEFEASLPHDSALVWALLTDVTFLETSAQKTGATEQDAEVEQSGSTVLTRLHWRVPTAGAPKIFQKWLPDQVDLVEETIWEDSAESSRHASVTVQVPKAPIKAGFQGRAALEVAEGHTRYAVDGEENVGLPRPLQGTAKSQLGKLLHAVMADRAALATEWLDGGYTGHGWTPPAK